MREKLRNTWARLRTLWDERVEKIFLTILIGAVVLTVVFLRMGQANQAIWIGGLAILLAGAIGLSISHEKKTWIQQIAPELIGLSIGVLAIDQLYQFRIEEQERRTLVDQIAHSSNMFAIEAVRRAQEQDWLLEGLLSGADLRHAYLTEADLSGADLSGADLSRAHLFDADLSYANLSGAYLIEAKLNGAYLNNAKLNGADLHNARLSNADLVGADLSHANLSHANLSGADLIDVDLIDANLSGAYLSGAFLIDSDLSGADLSNANLSGAYLSGADLSGANLSGANLSGAEYGEYGYTIWPEGFDPQASGAILK